MINAVHLHLILVHIPIVVVPLAAILLALQYFKQSDLIGNLSCRLLIISGVIAGCAYLSGENAEEISEKIPGVIESLIENHGDAALIALCLCLVTALLALITLYKISFLSSFRSLLFIMSCLSSLSLFWVGYQGGKIRHPEAYDVTSIVQGQNFDKDDD